MVKVSIVILLVKGVNAKLSRIKVINVPKKPPRFVLSGYRELPIEKEISASCVILLLVCCQM